MGTRIIETVGRYASMAMGALFGYLLPTLPFAALCFFAALLDCITSFRLARRLAKKYPDKSVIGKFRSEKAWAIFPVTLLVYACILLGYGIDAVIFAFIDLYLANVIAGGFCLWELWSILENESSENESSWAKFLQKFMVNKSARHFEDAAKMIKAIKDINEELKSEDEERRS